MIRILIMSVLAGMLSACGAAGTGNAGASAGGKIAALATTSVIADLVANVGGDRVAVSALLKPGADPHTFSPSPNEARAVADSQILFENGAGLEEWLAELVENAGGERPVVVVSQGVTPIEGFEHDDEPEHAGESVDPHMWFDPNNAIIYVENIRDGLTQVDPDGAATYTSNAAEYIEQLRALDAENEKQLAAIPAQRRKLVTNHDTFAYFAARYGFDLLGTIFEGVSTEEEPSPQQVAQLVARIREAGVPAIFAENTVNPRLAEQIGDEAGVRVVTDLYTDALGEPGSPGDSYLKMMAFDVAQIAKALDRE